MFEQGIASVGGKLTSINKSPAFKPVTKIVVKAGEKEFSSGSDSGRVVTVENPFGSQKMADDILSKLSGYVHRPVSADGVILDPTAELGDGMSLKGTYAGLYGIRTAFGPGMRASVTSPGESEIDHEIPAVPRRDRDIKRQFYGMGGRINDLRGDVEEAFENLNASVGEASSDLTLRAYADRAKKYFAAVTTLTSTVFDSESGLLLATKQELVNGYQTKEASAKMYASIDKTTASITASVKELDGKVKSLVEIKADLIALSGAVSVNDGALTVQGAITSTKGISNLQSLIVDNRVKMGALQIGDKAYTPQQITSNNGTTYAVLAQ